MEEVSYLVRLKTLVTMGGAVIKIYSVVHYLRLDQCNYNYGISYFLLSLIFFSFISVFFFRALFHNICLLQPVSSPTSFFWLKTKQSLA